jgi:hypothetical protein
MSLEKNVIFIYPIVGVLQQLKEQLEEEGSFMVYEMDSLPEYGQLIGIMEHSVTFSSDMKKTSKYLQENKNFVKKNESRNIVVTTTKVPPHLVSKLQGFGLNEVLKEDIPIKSLSYKIEMFFKTYEQKEKGQQMAKQKASDELQVLKIGSEKKQENSQEKLRVERMGFMQEEAEKGHMQNKKRNMHGLDLLGGKIGQGKRVDMSGFMGSPFDNMQRKKVTQFNAAQASGKLKRNSFKPVEPQLTRKKVDLNLPEKELHKKKVDFNLPEKELAKRKTTNLGFNTPDIKNKKVDFEEVPRELEKKDGRFEEVERDFEKEKVNFKEVERELNRKKTNFYEVEREEKDKPKFEEVERELNKKRHHFEEVEREHERKKLEQQESNDLEKKKALELEEQQLERKKRAVLDELVELERKKKTFQEVERDLEKKDGKFEEVEKDQSPREKKNQDSEEGSKRPRKFEEVELEHERKRGDFQEQELEKDPKKGMLFDEVDKDGDRKKFEEVEAERTRPKGVMDEKKKGSNKSNFEEGNIATHWGGKHASLDEVKRDVKEMDSLTVSEKKDLGEQTIDYSKLKKQYEEGDLGSDEAIKDFSAKKKLQELLEEPEYTYYEPVSYGMEYLVLIQDFYTKRDGTSGELFKFISFALMKSLSAIMTVFVFDEQKIANPVFSGHELMDFTGDLNWDEEFDKNIEEWEQIKLPTWSDNTFQEEMNSIVYPLFEEGEHYGLIVAHFENSIFTHEDAANAEMLLMTAKGVAFSLYPYGGKR